MSVKLFTITVDTVPQGQEPSLFIFFVFDAVPQVGNLSFCLSEHTFFMVTFDAGLQEPDFVSVTPFKITSVGVAQGQESSLLECTLFVLDTVPQVRDLSSCLPAEVPQVHD